MDKNAIKQTLIKKAKKSEFLNINMGIVLVFCQKDFSALNKKEITNNIKK